MPVPTIEEYKARTRKSWEGKPRQKDDTTRRRLGPEWPGCFNTGARPCLMSFKHRGETVWFAGPEDACREHYFGMVLKGTRQVGKGGHKVIRRATRAAAEAYFWTLCAVVLDAYREYERKREQAAALAATGNPEKMLQAANILADL